MYQCIAYLKFLCSATNQHGVHSPFIYNFITKGIYQKKINRSKTIDVLLKSISFLNAKNVQINTKNTDIQKLILTHQPDLNLKSDSFDICYYDHITSLQPNKLKKEGHHNDTMLLIHNIHKDKESTTRWSLIKDHSETRVTVDMFHCGAVFFRKEQEKEHFRIRI